MKTTLSSALIFPLLFAARLSAAEIPVPQPTEMSANSLATFPPAQRTAAQLDQLLGPIALYPDALIALILPAATEASDVVLAARYFAVQGDPAKVDDQPWDDSVRALAHYPDVVKWMDENLTWTKQVGEAFIEQPADVMKAVQRLRAAARAAGTLVDTPQQRVVTSDDAITIVPAQPEIIYVPSYDPDVVYLSRRDYYYPGPFLTFGVGYATGFWLGYDVDWSRNRIWVINRYERERYWREHRHVPAIVVRSNPRWDHDGVHHVWTPPAGHPRTFRPYSGPARTVIVRPSPFHSDGRRDGPRPPSFADRPDAPRQDLPRPPFDRGGGRWGSGAAAPAAPAVSSGRRNEPGTVRTAPRTDVQAPPAVQPAPQPQPQRQIPSRPAPAVERPVHDQRIRDNGPAPVRSVEAPRNAERPARMDSAPMHAAAPNPRSGGMSASAPPPQRVIPAPERAATAPAPAAPAAQSAPPPAPAPAPRTQQEVSPEARRSFNGRN